MKKTYLNRLLMAVVALPLLFSCSTSREFTAFATGTGGYHTPVKKTHPTAETAVQAEFRAESIVSQEMPSPELEATSDQAPDLTLNSVEARLKEAQAGAAQVNAGSTATKGQKPTFAQKLVVKKMQKMIEKASAKAKVKKAAGPNEISAPMIDQNLKMALIFLIAALIVGLFAGNPIFGLISLILLIVALVFFLLWVVSL